MSSLWLLPLTVVGLIVMVAIAQHLRHYAWMQDFIERYPGTSAPRGRIEPGLPAWLRWQHLFNLVFMMFIIRAGLQILADHPRLYLNSGSTREPRGCGCAVRFPGAAQPRRPGPGLDREGRFGVPAALAGDPGPAAFDRTGPLVAFRVRCALAVERSGVLYVLLFSTGQWRRIVPQSWDVVPNAASTAIQYASLDFPANEGFVAYNGLQLMAYFLTVFVFAPAAFVTGLMQAPRSPRGSGWARGLPTGRSPGRCIF